ncbi:MAG: AAA family ATPase [Acidobacteria bacterium]|nr:AAA family ATPase [Acidobacteriota bacterium]
MKLIIIHGPPAAGKLTIANAISRRTDFKVFHNHLTIDCTEPVFEFGTQAFWDINGRLRCDVIAEAARQGIDLIHTFCYGKGPDDADFRQLVAAATENGGKAHIVLVHCRDEVRKERIVDESRVRMRKLTDPASVDHNPLKMELTSPHPDFEQETLVIDTSDMSPDESAELILEHFGLRRSEAN